MSNLKRLNRALRAGELQDPLLLWRKVLVVAITSNSYSVDDQIKVLMWLHQEQYKDLLEWADAISQHVYEEPMLHYRMHQIAALIRKYPLPSSLSGLKPREAAYASFLAAEHRCKRVNQRFRALRACNRDPFAAVTKHAQDWIRYVLGSTVPYTEIYQNCNITPGAAIGVHGNATNLARKLLCDRWTVTPGAYHFALEAIWENSQMSELLLLEEGRKQFSADPKLLRERLLQKVEYVCHNKIAFVPKTAKTHRSIAVEPFLNTFLQNGVDAVLKNRLKRVGIDLRDQETNSHLAYLGSIADGSNEKGFCTIDLSSASDTLAKEVVRELLPEDWYLFLSSLRSSSYRIKNSDPVRYHKFTSMGNGFCFPLESLIFSAIAHAVYVVCRQNPVFRVYGDDIIVQRGVFQPMLDALRWFGFIPNPRKTFGEGPFRESCGKDWHCGVNVRPIFLDHPLDTLGRIFGFHNQSRRRESYVEHYFDEVRLALKESVPAHLRFCSPYDPGPCTDIRVGAEASSFRKQSPTIDGAFWVPIDEFMASKYSFWNRNTRSWGYYSLRTRASEDSAPALKVHRCYPLVYNIAALRGAASRKTFTLRYTSQTDVVRINYS